jgi:hypothetical protein
MLQHKAGPFNAVGLHNLPAVQGSVREQRQHFTGLDRTRGHQHAAAFDIDRHAVSPPDGAAALPL